MDTAKIVRIVALAVAVIGAFVAIPQAALIMAVVGLALGFLAVTEERRMMFMVTTITLALVSGSLGSVPAVGGYLDAILGNLSSILNAGSVAVILLIIKDRLTE